MDESRLFSNQRGRLPGRESVILADLILKGEKMKLPVNIIFTSDKVVEDLNYRFRRRRRPTDVLSFPADEELGILGDIYISIDTARGQASEYGATLREEILRLVCHGILHLCGYDHHNKRDAEKMKTREEHYFGGLLKNA
jgi:probable rRNA maturation factor